MEQKSLNLEKNNLILSQYGHLSNIFLVIGMAISALTGKFVANFAFNPDFVLNLKSLLINIFTLIIGSSSILLSYRLRTLEFLKKKIRIKN